MLLNFKFYLFILVFCFSTFVYADRNEKIENLLNSYSFDQENYTLIIENLSKPDKLFFFHNDKKYFNAASLVKILTTFIALDELGPKFRWRSDLFIKGEIKEGVLNGDVIFKGRGDASFSIVDLEKMVRKLRDFGVKEIKGNLVLDYSYFGDLSDEINFDDDPMRAYNVLPNAISIQSNTVNFKFYHHKESVNIETEPRLPNFQVINKILSTQESCNSWKNKIEYDAWQESNVTKILFDGKLSKKCINKEIDLSVVDNDKYFYEIFTQLWRQNGGIFNGDYESVKIDDESLIYVTTHYSRVLSEIIRDINKFSLNLMSRNLMLTVITERKSIPADETMVEEYINSWFGAKTYSKNNLFIDNGAGLSRNIKITGIQLRDILKEIYYHPFMPELMASFPISAIDGTLEKRMLYSPINSKGHLKTGSLRNVNAIAGFFQNQKKEMILFVFIMNDKKANFSVNLQEKLINEVFYLN